MSRSAGSAQASARHFVSDDDGPKCLSLLSGEAGAKRRVRDLEYKDACESSASATDYATRRQEALAHLRSPRHSDRERASLLSTAKRCTRFGGCLPASNQPVMKMS